MFEGIRIRTKIFWAIFLTVTISTATVIYLIHFHFEKRIINEYEQIAIQDSRGKARVLSNTISHFKRMANQIAESIPNMNNWKEYLSNKNEIFPEIEGVFVVNKKGKILFQSISNENLTPLSGDILQSLFSKATSNGAILVSSINQENLKNNVFVLSGMTRLKNGQSPVSVFLELNIPYIFDSVLNYPSEKGMIQYYFVSRNGIILFTGNSAEIGRKISDLPTIKEINQKNPVNIFGQNSVHSFEFLDRKSKMFIFQTPMEFGEFGIIEQENLSPILSAFQAKPQFLGIVIVLNLLIILLISELLAAYFSRPLRSLVNTLGSYQIKGIIPPMRGINNRRDEYGILARQALGYIEEIEKKNQQIQKTLEQLKISEKRYFQFLNHSPNIVFVAESHRIIFANKNAEEVLGIKLEDRTDYSNVLTFKNLQGQMYPLLNIYDFYKDFPIEGTLVLKNQELPILLYYTRFEFENTSNELFILVDVRRIKQLEIEEKQMEWKLIESNRLASLGILTAGITHNLHNPLNSIISLSEILKMKYPDENEINAILEAANQMEKTILLVTDRNKNEIVDRKIEIQLNDLLTDSLKLLKMNHRLRFAFKEVVDFDPQLPPIVGWYGDFSISLEAFLYNAIEAMEHSKQKVLTVTTRLRENHIAINISDTGSGIARENLNKIFLPFFTTKRSDGNSGNVQNHNVGLGLFIAYRLLQSYGAKIDVRSQIKNGTTFIITIPIHLSAHQKSEVIEQNISI